MLLKLIQIFEAMAMWSEDSNPMFGSLVPQMLMVVCMLAVPWMLLLGWKARRQFFFVCVKCILWEIQTADQRWWMYMDVHGCTHCRVVFVGSPAEDSETLYSAPAKPGSFPSQIWLGHVLPTSASQLKHGARCNPGQRRSASVPAVMA